MRAAQSQCALPSLSRRESISFVFFPALIASQGVGKKNCLSFDLAIASRKGSRRKGGRGRRRERGSSAHRQRIAAWLLRQHCALNAARCAACSHVRCRLTLLSQLLDSSPLPSYISLRIHEFASLVRPKHRRVQQQPTQRTAAWRQQQRQSDQQRYRQFA